MSVQVNESCSMCGGLEQVIRPNTAVRNFLHNNLPEYKAGKVCRKCYKSACSIFKEKKAQNDTLDQLVMRKASLSTKPQQGSSSKSQSPQYAVEDPGPRNDVQPAEIHTSLQEHLPNVPSPVDVHPQHIDSSASLSNSEASSTTTLESPVVHLPKKPRKRKPVDEVHVEHANLPEDLPNVPQAHPQHSDSSSSLSNSEASSLLVEIQSSNTSVSSGAPLPKKPRLRKPVDEVLVEQASHVRQREADAANLIARNRAG